MPNIVPGHLRTIKVSLPSELNCRSMLLCNTRIAVITTIIENTPTSAPNSVSAERSLCAAMAVTAIEALSRASVKMAKKFLLIAQRLHRVHAGGAPGGEKSRQRASDGRNKQCQTDDARRHG